jgi:asparagine N-glycosylation enzyme membrane subunit Stt3
MERKMMLLLPILLLVLLLAVMRRITAPFRYGFRGRWPGYDPYYNPYLYGCRRHHRLLGRFLPIVALIVLDRVITRRYW